MADAKQYQIKVSVDAAGVPQAAKQTTDALKEIAASTSAATDESKRYADALFAMSKASDNARAGAAAEDAAIRKRIEAKKQELALRKEESARGARAAEAVEYSEALKRIGNDAKTMGVETAAATAKGKLFGSHLGELKKAAGQLSQEFPVAGMALRAFISPVGAAAAVSIGAFVAAKQAIADYLALFRELPNVTTPWMKQFESWQKVVSDSAKSWADYRKAMEEALNPKTTTSGAADKQVAGIKSAAAERSAGVDRGAALAEAQDRYAVSQGRMTPEEAAVRSAQRAKAGGDTKAGIAAQAGQAEIAVVAAAKKRLEDELAFKRPEARIQAEAAAAAGAAKEAADTAKATAAERWTNSKKDVADADAAAAPYDAPSWMDDSLLLRGVRRRGRAAAQGQRERAKDGERRAFEDFVQAAGQADRAGAAASAAGGSASAAAADAVSTAQALTRVSSALPELMNAAKAQAAASTIEAMVRALDAQTRQQEAMNARIANIESRESDARNQK